MTAKDSQHQPDRAPRIFSGRLEANGFELHPTMLMAAVVIVAIIYWLGNDYYGSLAHRHHGADFSGDVIMGLLTGGAASAIVLVLTCWVPCAYRHSRAKAYFRDHEADLHFWETTSFMRHSGGIGVADDEVSIVKDDLIWRIPFHLIRDYSWKIAGYNQSSVYATGPGATAIAAQASFDNARARTMAMHESGFFLQIADLKRPNIHIVCPNQATLERWLEAMNQGFERYHAAKAEE